MYRNCDLLVRGIRFCFKFTKFFYGDSTKKFLQSDEVPFSYQPTVRSLSLVLNYPNVKNKNVPRQAVRDSESEMVIS